MNMSAVIKFFDSPTPAVIVLPNEDCLLFEDAVIQSCRDRHILPAARHLFALKNQKTGLYMSPSDLLCPGVYELRLRFWPSLPNFCLIGSSSLNYFYDQVCLDFVEGRIPALHHSNVQSIALGLSATAMHCHMHDRRASMNDTLSNYKRFVPKPVRKNANLRYSQEPLKKLLKEWSVNPPGDVWFCKEQFLKVVSQTAPDYPIEKYSVIVEEGPERLEYDLVIQPMNPDFPGIKLQPVRKKIVRKTVLMNNQLGHNNIFCLFK